MDLLSKGFVGLLSALFLLPNLYAMSPAKPIICNQKYALCTSARCIPAPGSTDEAICDCVVEKGNSAGYKTCEQRKPGLDKYKVTSLVSTFSFAQFATKKPMNCAEGLPWTNCVDMPCTVDPQNSKRALCKCKIYDSQAYFTFGGSCKTNTCATGFWSGATERDGIILRNALKQTDSVNAHFTPKACNAQPSSN